MPGWYRLDGIWLVSALIPVRKYLSLRNHKLFWARGPINRLWWVILSKGPVSVLNFWQVFWITLSGKEVRFFPGWDIHKSYFLSCLLAPFRELLAILTPFWFSFHTLCWNMLIKHLNVFSRTRLLFFSFIYLWDKRKNSESLTPFDFNLNT